MNDLVVQALQAAIQGATIKPDLTDYRAARIAELEATVREFCEYIMDSGDNIGMPASFHREFRNLCECVSFDPYPAEADPDAAYDRERE